MTLNILSRRSLVRGGPGWSPGTCLYVYSSARLYRWCATIVADEEGL